MDIAQLVERWIVAPEVAGSSPSIHPINNMTYHALYDLIQRPKLDTVSVDTLAGSTSSTTNVSSLLQFTIPDGKLFYPEPFIASPSYLHSDLTYLHIFQY